jgi:hypothetical protein
LIRNKKEVPKQLKHSFDYLLTSDNLKLLKNWECIC